MNKILIVNSSLTMGGAEKLVYELAIFAQKENISATVLILDNYQREYYDDLFKQKNINVIRTRLHKIKHFRAPFKMARSIYWSIKLKFFANKIYDSVHLMGLYNIYKIKDTINHRHRFFWHTTNAIQEKNGSYNFHESYFDNERDTIVCINSYQIDELKQHYDESKLNCKIRLFRLFIND